MANIIDIIIRADVEGEGEIKSLKGDFGSLEVSAGSMAKGFAAAALSLTALVGGLAGLKRAITESIRLFASFDDTMRAVAAVSGATAEQFAEMTELAKEMGETTRFTAQEAADALRVLSIAGLSAKDAMEALPQVLSLAAASSTDLATSTQILTQVMAGYGLTASELGRVNDVLVKTFTSTNTNLTDLGQAFTFVGPLAKSLGLELEETSAVLGQLADSGLRGTKGGRALRAALAALIAPTTNAGKLFKKLGVDTKEMGIDLAGSASALKSLGVEIEDTTTGKIRPFVDILEDLKSGLNELPTEVQRNIATMTIFGKVAGTAMITLLGKTEGSLKKFTQELKESGGIANKVAEDMEAGLGGELRRMRAAIEGVALEFADKFSPALIEALENTRNLVTSMRETVVIQFGGLISDIITLGNSAADTELKFSAMEESLKVMAGAIIVVRQIFQGLVFEVKEVVKLLTVGVLNSIQVIQSVIGDVRSIISEDWAEAIRNSSEKLKEMSNIIQDEMLKDAQDYSKSVVDLEIQLTKLFETTERGGGTTSQAFKDIQKEVETLSIKVEQGTITQEQYNAEITKLEEKSKTAFKAGNTDLEKVTELLSKAKSEAGAVSEETKKLGEQFNKTSQDVLKFGNAVSTAGKESLKTLELFLKTPEEIKTEWIKGTDEISVALEKLADRGELTGAALNIFAEGIQTAETLKDVEQLIDVFERAADTGKIFEFEFTEGLEIARKKAGELASQAIISARNIEELAVVMRSIKDSSIDFGNELSTNLLPKLSEFSTIDLQNLQNQFDTLFANAIIDAQTFDDVSESISNTLSEKLGVSARDFETNITNAVSESIKQFNLLAENSQVAGEVLVEAFSGIIKKAETDEDLQFLETQLEELAATGKLSLAALGPPFDKLTHKTGDPGGAAEGAVDDLDSLGGSVENVGAGANTSAEGLENIITSAEAAMSAAEDAFNAGEISSDKFANSVVLAEKAITSAEWALFDLGEQAEDTAEAGDALANTFVVPWRRDVITGIEDTGIELKKLFDFIVDNMIDAVSKYGSEYAINFDKMNDKMLVFVELQKKGFQEFANVLEFQKITGRDMTDELNNMIDSFELLDQKTLENLKNQVEELNETVKDARETAADFVEDFQEQLLRMEGDILAIETAEFERKKRELEQLLDETIDTIAQKDLKEALKLLEQIHQEKLKKILEEEQAKKEAAERANDFEKTLIDDDEDIRDETITEADKKDVTRITEQDITVTINAPFAVHEDYVRVQIIPTIEEIGLDLSRARDR